MHAKKRLIDIIVYWVWPVAWILILLLAFAMVVYISYVRP